MTCLQQKERKKPKGFIKVSIEKALGGFYDRDRAVNYFRFISILKLIKTILKLLDKFRKYDGNDMSADVAQRERSNINCYTSTFSII